MNILSNRDYGYVPENEFVSKAEKCREMYEIIDFRINSNSEKNEEQDIVIGKNLQTDKSQSEAISKNSIDIALQQKEIKANEKAIQEQRQAIQANEKAIADLVEGNYVSKEVSEELASLIAQVSMLESKVNDMSKTDMIEITNIEGDKVSDITKDLVISNVTIEEKTTIKGKTVTINNLQTKGDDNRLVLNGADVAVNNLKVEGNFDKAKGNAIMVVDGANYITLKDSTINPTNAYNGIEIGLSGIEKNAPKNVTIDNCVFGEGFTNNAILIHKTSNNAIVNITNCTFEKIGNVLRLSNSTNASGITVNITNCVVKDFVKNYNEEGEVDYTYQGLILLQDYTSKQENVNENNLFGNRKIKINISNVTTPDGKVINPEDMAEVLGCGCQKQIAYVYRNTDKRVLEYNGENYPIFNIK